MRTPKPPIGFVPVDSEEAKGIADDYAVNTACVSSSSRWHYNCFSMKYVRDRAKEYPDRHYHVQLPPPVEWEEVWEWGVDAEGPYLLRNGKGFNWNDLGYSFMDTIVRALNEMENKNE